MSTNEIVPSKIEQLWQARQLHYDDIAFLILQDSGGPSGLWNIPIPFVQDLFFFRILFSVYPSIAFYLHPPHQFNSHTVRKRHPYWLRICSKASFDPSRWRMFGDVFVKFLYIRGDVDDSLVKAIASFKRKPIVVCDFGECEKFTSTGLTAISFGDASAQRLTEEVRQAIKNLADSSRLSPLEPNAAACMQQIMSGLHNLRFEDSVLEIVGFHGETEIQPTEYLLNILRRKFVPTKTTPIQRNQITTISMSNYELAKQQIILDELVAMHRTKKEIIPCKQLNAVNEFVANGDDKQYEALLASIKSDEELDFPLGILFCVPCLNKKSLMLRIGKTLRERSLAPLFAPWTEGYDFPLEESSFKDKQDFKVALAMKNLVHSELGIFSGILTMYSVSERLPVIFTPKLASSLFSFVTHVSQRYRDKNWTAFRKSLVDLGNLLREAIPKPIIDLLRRNPERIRVISDLPLEWLDIDGVPLAFRTRVSRLPMSHGPLLLSHYAISYEDIEIGLEQIDNVLTINCLEPCDDLFPEPKHLHKWLDMNHLSHKYYEAKTMDEYFSILAKERPLILIHFGHGSYDFQRNHGSLHIGKNHYNMFEISPSVVPPIVLLGSCWTAAASESTFDTPALAYLSMGARAVLGTLLPVQADRTNILFSDILLTLRAAILDHHSGVDTWGKVVFSALSRSNYRDVILNFNANRRTGKRIPEDQTAREFEKLWQQRFSPNSRSSLAESYNAVDELLIEAVKTTAPHLVPEFSLVTGRDIGIPHSCFFSHLGSPDTIKLRKQSTDR